MKRGVARARVLRQAQSSCAPDRAACNQVTFPSFPILYIPRSLCTSRTSRFPLPRTLVRPLVGVGAKVGNPAQTVALVEGNKGNVPPLLRNGRRTPVLVVLLDRRELEARHRPGDPSVGSGRCARRPRVDLWQCKCLWSYMQRRDSQPVLPRAVDRVRASVDDGKAAPRLAPKLLAPRRDQ